MSKERGSAQLSSKITKYINAIGRVLRCTRDFYESTTIGMTKGKSGPIIAMSQNRSHAMHHSRTSNIEDDIDELIRAASVAKLRAIPIKSHSVATMRIDEDHECNFDDDLAGSKAGLGIPRSKSCITANKKKAGALA